MNAFQPKRAPVLSEKKKEEKPGLIERIKRKKADFLKITMSPSLALALLTPGEMMDESNFVKLKYVFEKFIHEVKYDEEKGKEIVTLESYENGPKRPASRVIVLERIGKEKYQVLKNINDCEDGIRVIETKEHGFEDCANPFYRK